jgi:hypothetical protein
VGSPDVVILSLGAGVQSSTLYRMAALGELDKVPDYAIFADTKQEPHWVYENLDSLEKDHGNAIPIIRATAGDLGEAIVKGVNTTGGRFASVPFWVKRPDGTEAPGGRQCTREYKIDVVKKAVRELLGLKPRAHRMKPSRYGWVHTRWPLIELMMSRQACKWWLEERGYPVPGKSACVFCPYRRLAEYARWREEEPELFDQACRMDDLIRSSGTMKGMRGQQFILRTLVPLREVPPVSELNGDGPHQMDLFGEECEGMCGV